MCGLVTVINKQANGFTNTQLEVFEHLLYIDVVRGEDATGVFGITNGGAVLIAKDSIQSADFLRTPEYDKIRRRMWGSGRALVGHNRKATRGAISDENAHPFWVKDEVILVHNGTMYGDHKKHADVEVDSHAIAHVLHETTDVEEALNKINAAYALIWYDTRTKYLNFVRNSERPLHWVETDDAWYITSEAAMLRYVVDRFNLKVKAPRKGHKESIYEFPEHYQNIWELSGNIKVETKKLKITPVVKYTAALPGTGGQQHAPFTPTATALTPLTESGAPSKAITNIVALTREMEVENIKSFPSIKYKQWALFKDTVYAVGKELRVLVDDLSINSEPYVVHGRTMDVNQARVTLPITKELADKITQPGIDDVVMSCVVDMPIWRRSTSCKATSSDEWDGFMTLRCTKGTVLYMGESSHAC
jgi:hypothetical protein